MCETEQETGVGGVETPAVSNSPRRQAPNFQRPHESARPEPGQFASRHSLLARRQQRVRHRTRRRRTF